MKKIILTIALIISVYNLHAEQYRRLLNETNKWNYLYEVIFTCYCGEAITYSYTVSNDTVIELQKYKKIMCNRIHADDYQNIVQETKSYAAALREDSAAQKIYVVYPGQTSESLLYNFNLHAGDTIEVKNVYHELWQDSKTIRLVKSVEQYNIGSFSGKVITVCDSIFTNYRSLHWPYAWSEKNEYNTNSWYEGIGSFISLLQSNVSEYYGTKLLCFWSGNEQLYHDPSHPDCVYAYWMATEKVTEKSTVLVASVTNDRLLVNENIQVKNIQLYNSKGEKVMAATGRETDISGLSGGMYFVRVQTESGEIRVAKFIKTE